MKYFLLMFCLLGLLPALRAENCHVSLSYEECSLEALQGDALISLMQKHALALGGTILQSSLCENKNEGLTMVFLLPQGFASLYSSPLSKSCYMEIHFYEEPISLEKTTLLEDLSNLLLPASFTLSSPS